MHRVKRIGKERCKRKMEETIESTQEVEQMVSRGTQETIPSLLRKEMLRVTKIKMLKSGRYIFYIRQLFFLAKVSINTVCV